LVIVKLSDVEPPTAIGEVPNALEIDGGATTVKSAEALSPVPPFADVTAPEVLLLTPAVVPVTFTESVHDPPAVKDAPERLTFEEPASAMVVPPHVLLSPFGVDTSRPAGSGSLNPTPESAVPAFGLVSVNVKPVEPFSGTEPAPNALEIDGGPTTDRLADAVLPVPVAVELTAPDVLFLTPAVVPVTSAASVHDAFALTVPPDKLMVPDPAVAVAVPPHVFVNPFGDDTTNPDGRLSVNATPGSDSGFEFAIVNVRPVVPFNGIVGDANALLIEGASPTFRLASDSLPFPASVDVTGNE
jgi:hypothetical protein